MSWITRFAQALGLRSNANVRIGVKRRGFAAARVDRLTAGFTAVRASINQELRGDLNLLRARARQLAKDNDYAHKFVNLCVTNIVGPGGVKFQARVVDQKGQADTLDNDAIEGAFTQFCERGVFDVTGRLSRSEFESAIVRSLATDGEYLVRIVRGASAGNAWGIAFQHIDIDRLDTSYSRAKTASQNAIVMGVEVNDASRPTHYHVFTGHPNDHSSGAMRERERERIPAQDIIHDFLTERAEQVRGVPWMSAVILTLFHLGEFEKSALLAARKGADTLGFFVTPDGTPDAYADGKDANNEAISISVPGQYDTLPAGVDFKPYESKYPDQVFSSFTKSFLSRAASGLNVSYHGLSGDLEGVNFSSIRAGVIDERDQWMTLQGFFINGLCRRIFDEWLRVALLRGKIVNASNVTLPASKLEKFRAVNFQGRRWQWVDPEKDINASLLAIRAGLSSPYTIAAQMGLDLEDVLRDIARANTLSKSYGLPLFASPAPPPPAPPPPTKDEAKHIIHVAAPAVTVYPTFRVDAPISVITPEPKVTLEAQINVPERTVNLNVEGAKIDVHASPSISTLDVIGRDASGEIATITRRPLLN
jgi:lambda family phage portal protein